MSNESALDRSNKREPVSLTETDCKALLQRCEEAITDICEECHYDADHLKPTNWAYITNRIGQEIFTHIPQLIHKYNPASQSYKKGEFIDDNLLLIYDKVFYPLCLRYGQIVSAYSFFRFIGTDENGILEQWDRKGKVTSSGISIRQRLLSDREHTLSNAMLSTNHNPVKFLAIGNHEFAWNESRRQKTIVNRPVLSLSEVPDLTGVELSDNIALPDFGDDE